MSITPATQEEIDLFLKAHPLWKAGDTEVLLRSVETADYASALEVAMHIGKLADELDHHPVLTIEWGKVVITLTTHDAGNRISPRDIDMAEKIDSMFPTK